MVYTAVSKAVAFGRGGSTPLRRTVSEHGGTVYTMHLKRIPFGVESSNLSVRTKIAVDWHDTLQDYSSPFIGWYAYKHGIQLPADANGKSFAELGIAAITQDFREFENSEHIRGLHNITGAQSAIARLSKKFEIVVISSAPVVLEMKDVISKEFPQVSDYFWAEHKAPLVKKLGAVVLIDDIIKNLVDLDCLPICYAQPWNINFGGYRGDWQYIMQLVDKLWYNKDKDMPTYPNWQRE